jgi:hypothetical protein
MRSRQEIVNLNDVLLQVMVDGARHRILEDWSRNYPGNLSDVYDLALGLTECAVRGLKVAPFPLPDQRRLFDD